MTINFSSPEVQGVLAFFGLVLTAVIAIASVRGLFNGKKKSPEKKNSSSVESSLER